MNRVFNFQAGPEIVANAMQGGGVFQHLRGGLDGRRCGHEDRRMLSLPVEPALRAEWDALHALRNDPRILPLVEAAAGSELQLQKQLRRDFSDPVVRAAISLVELRRRAGVKFSRASQMWFDRRGLEQSTSEPVARHKAQRFYGSVADFCCGIGADSIALAANCDVVAIDSSPLACLRTTWNAAVYECDARVSVVCGDVELFEASDRLVHIDPDRRAHGSTRSVHIEDYVPGLPYLQAAASRLKGGAIKLSPAANFGGKFAAAEIELVSLRGECKEAVVWFGALAGTAPWRATVLPSGETLAGDPMEFFVDQSPPQRYLYDPDPAVVRAGLVDAAASRLGLCRLDREEEYLTGSAWVESPFVQGFELIAELPNNPREIRQYFRASRAGQVEVKCRRIPIVAESIRRKLPLPGDEPLVLIFARLGGRARALVGRRLATVTHHEPA